MQPLDKIELLKQREIILNTIRKFLKMRKFVEVSTPILVEFASGSEGAHPIEVNINVSNKYLRTCPEVELKKLVGMGLNRVFEIGKSFRREIEDNTHLTEFTTMEMYHTNITLSDMLGKVIRLLGDLNPKWKREKWIEMPYSEAVKKYGEDFDKKLIKPTVIYDFPIALSAYAKKRKGKSDIAQRFELYIQGIEIANFYTEIDNWEEQEERMKSGLYLIPYDTELIETLKKGFPPTVGGGIGIDRLIMLLLKQQDINNTK